MAIYLTFRSFFLFLISAKLFLDLLDQFSRFLHQMKGISVNVVKPVQFFLFLKGRCQLPWQPILCRKKNTNHARFLQFSNHMKAFSV